MRSSIALKCALGARITSLSHDSCPSLPRISPYSISTKSATRSETTTSRIDLKARQKAAVTTILVDSIWSRTPLAISVTPAAKRTKDQASTSSERSEVKSPSPIFSSAISADSSSRALYRSAKLGDLDINLGQIVELRDSTVDPESQATALGLVTTLFTEKSGKQMMQVRKMVRAPDTVLGDAGQEWDLMLTEDLEDWELDSDIVRVLDAECTAHRPWDWNLRRKHFQDDEVVRKTNDETKASGGSSFKYLYRHLYKPDDGMFAIIPEQMVKITGNYLAPAPMPADLNEIHSADGKGIILKGTEYRIGDFIYLIPKSKSSPDLLQIAQIMLKSKDGLLVKHLARPESLSSDDAYQAAWNELVWSKEDPEVINLDVVAGKCGVTLDRSQLVTDSAHFDHTFVLTLGSNSSSPPPPVPPSFSHTTPIQPLTTMDIFSGAGGLSSGLHQAGVSLSKWAIEFDAPAARAYKMNYPDAKVMTQDCSLLLEAALRANGAEADIVDGAIDNKCLPLPPQVASALPKPGEVELLVGGPPCQGFSLLNRQPSSESSKLKNALVLTYLSYCDYYRPRYFLLENVRSFCTHEKGRTLALTLASLLEMGYQVRVGILNAGGFGVPQSRRRTFIWAAAPGETLPDWPTPHHSHDATSCKIHKFKGGGYEACKLRAFPLRAVTVKDAIFDLPSIANGYQKEDPIDHPASKRVSAYQKFIQGNAGGKITDHICNEMNELDMERIRHVRRGVKGADWHDIPDDKFNGIDLIPACLRPKPAGKACNKWVGLFGRLSYDDIFPTMTTTVGPMRKVGRCLHPEQDRMISVRECARAQGFPDDYLFAGKGMQRPRSTSK